MSSPTRYNGLSNDQLRLVHGLCRSFERALCKNDSPSIESQIKSAPEEVRIPLFRELLAVELEFHVTSNSLPNIDEYLARFPDHHNDIRQVFQEAEQGEPGGVNPRVEQRGSHAPNDDPNAEAIGSVIGPYKLRELIGEGGMGLVYVAEQEVPVHRQVALKIIKPGMDTKEVIARFESERQALALMDHPHIAHVLDAGATDTGRPYFVMELIRGVPVTEYCNKHKLSTRTRLELFVQICQAVQHAHQKGIIHRDIKPSNILVILHGDVPVPKVIDFGVAKAMNQRLTERTFYTQTSQLVGTPMYMSPEQAERSALAVDTRTDIYSLGVVLYELLVGTTPFTKERLSKVGHDELRRIIRDEDPPRPSHRLSTLDAKAQSTVSDHRSAGQLNLVHVIRGELDWIVMKAMEKDLTRRYEMARDLAADIQHYLADEPVLACPPSARYRLRKFARRNKVALAMAILVGVGLLAAISGLIVSNIMIKKQKNAADENFRLAREAVDRYFTLVSEDRQLDRHELGQLRKGLIDNAVEFYELLLERRANDPDLLVAAANNRVRLAAFLHRVGRIEDAVPELERAFDVIEELLTRMPAGAKEFRNLPGYYHYWPVGTVRRSDSERAVFKRAVSLWRQFADAHPDVAAFRRDLAFFLPLANKHLSTQEEMETLTSVQQLREELVEQHPENREMLAELASTIWHMGYLTKDPSVMSDGIAKLIKADLNEQVHRASLATYLGSLGWRLMDQGQNAEAAVELQKSVVIYRELGYDFDARSRTSDLARALLNSGQQTEAEQLVAELSPRTASDFVLRGNIYKELRMVDKAMADYNEALKTGLQGRLPRIARVGVFLDEHGQHEKAIVFYNHDLPTSPAPSRIYARRGASWAHLKQYDKALADFTYSIEFGPFDCEHHLNRMRPSMLRESPTDFQEEYLKLADRAIEITEGTGQSYITRSLVLFNLGRREEAKKDLARGIELDADFEIRWYLQPLLKELRAEAKGEPGGVNPRVEP